MKSRLLGVVSVLIIAMHISMSAQAVMVVAPGAAASIEGDTYNVYPFRLEPEAIYQQLYDASLFGGQSGIVEQILFRIDSLGSPGSSTFDLEVRLSHTSVTPDTMSTTFADNIGTDEMVVLSGVSEVSSGTITPGVNPFDVVLDINDIFLYNGVDNLLLQITIFESLGGSTPWLDAVSSSFPGGDLMQRLWNFNIDDPIIPGNDITTGIMLEPRGLVTAFEISAVPIPPALYLFGTGLIGLGGMARRKVP